MMRLWMQLARGALETDGPELVSFRGLPRGSNWRWRSVRQYDTYAPQVWEPLRSGASKDEIASHLRSVRERSMEMGGDEQDARAAEKLREWWRWRSDENGSAETGQLLAVTLIHPPNHCDRVLRSARQPCCFKRAVSGRIYQCTPRQRPVEFPARRVLPDVGAALALPEHEPQDELVGIGELGDDLGEIFGGPAPLDVPLASRQCRDARGHDLVPRTELGERPAQARGSPSSSGSPRCLISSYARRKSGIASSTPRTPSAEAAQSRTVSWGLRSIGIRASAARGSPNPSSSSIAHNWPKRSKVGAASTSGRRIGAPYD